MIQFRRLALFLSLTSLLFLIFLSLYFFLEKPKRISKGSQIRDKRSVVLREAFYIGEKKGKVDLKLKAEILKKDLEKNEIELEKIEGSYFSEGKEIVSFTGKKGLVSVDRKFGIVSDLKARTDKGYEVETESVKVDLESLSADGKDRVRIRGENLQMEGFGIEGDLKEGKFRIVRDVRGLFDLDGERYRFLAGSFIYEPRESTYIFDMGFKADGKDVSISCRRMRVIFHPGGIDRLEAEGNTEIKTGDTLAKSESAVYDFKEKVLVLKGKAKIVRNGIELKGEAIEYDLKEAKLESFLPKVKLKGN